MKTSAVKKLTRALMLVCAASAGASALGDDVAWKGDGAFNSGDNWWSGAQPAETDTAQFKGEAAGKTVTFDGSYKVNYVWVGETEDYKYITDEGAVAPVVFSGEGGGLASNGAFSCADGANQRAAVTFESGTYSAGACSYWAWGDNAKFKATIKGAVNFNGVNGDFAGFSTMLGTGVDSTIDIDGGTFAVNGGDLVIGVNADATSSTTINIFNGGVLSCGSDITERWVKLGNSGTGATTINVNENGTLAFWFITHVSTGDCAINVDGGTLKALGATTHGAGLIDVYNDATLTVTVGPKGATLDTNGQNLKVSKLIKGEGNTLNVVGGGSVSFTVQPECAISAADGTTVTEDWPVGNVWQPAGQDNLWSNADNWSLGAVPGDGDTVVINTASTIVLGDDDKVDTLILNSDVRFESGKLSFNAIDGSSKITLVGASLQVLKDAPLTVAAAIEVVGGSNKIISKDKNGYLRLTGPLTGDADSSVEFTISSKANGGGVQFLGDKTGFNGSATISLNGNPRPVHYFYGYGDTTDGVNANAWDMSASAWTFNYGTAAYTGGGKSGLAYYFPLRTSNAKYSFGSLNGVFPNFQIADNSTFSGMNVEIGARNENCSLTGGWHSNILNSGFTWVAGEGAVFTTSVSGTAFVNVTGGGSVAFDSATGVPAALNFTDNGGFIVVSDDSAINAAALAAISAWAAGADFGFVYDGEGTAELDISSRAALFAGRTIVKKGAGDLCLTGVPETTDFVVAEGTLVLKHGAKVGDISIAEDASLEVDLLNAVDGETVLTFGSISGDGTATWRNKASIATVNKGDTTWTLAITGGARTFVWAGEDGASWTDASSWTVDGEPVEDIPSVVDTAMFTADAVIAAAGEIGAKLSLADGVTVTIPTGLTFASGVEFGEGAKIAFLSSDIGFVGSTVNFVTIGNSTSLSLSNFILPAQSTYSKSLQNGVLAVTRNAGVYTWAPAGQDNSWAAAGNWKVGSVVVNDIPAAEDSVVFPASTDDGFEYWDVSLPWDVYATSVTIEGNLRLSGERTLKTPLVGGTAELQLNGAHLGCNGADLVVNTPLRLVDGTTNYIYLQKLTSSTGYSADLYGELHGSGTLIAHHGDTQNVGVRFHADLGDFHGTFEATKYNNRDHTDMLDSAFGSEHAVWRTSPSAGGGSGPNTPYIIHDSTTLYKFGAYIGGFWVAEFNPQIEIGARADVESDFTMSSNADRARYTITKVGDGVMKIGNTRGTAMLSVLNANGGTSVIKAMPGTLTFGGGVIKTPAYDVTTTVNEEQITERYYVDPSAVIQNSTGPIGFTNDAGEEHEWTSELLGSNKGGFLKKGEGKLTIVTPGYSGLTTIEAGTLVIKAGQNDDTYVFGDKDHALNALGQGTLNGATGTYFAYPEGTVLDGSETADDSVAVVLAGTEPYPERITATLDFSNVVKIDISELDGAAEALMGADGLCDGYVVIAGVVNGEVKGINKNIELVLPEKPEGAAESKWRNFTVRTMTVDGKTCVCVAQGSMPFRLFLR